MLLSCCPHRSLRSVSPETVYQSATGDDLSLLDLICLVAAIPATIGYKLAAGAAPFPDDATTTALKRTDRRVWAY